ncbi:hypothetical protein QNO07_09390 [Streptomyces sp. 549]|uniref:hypothetical protein n=1 Tax=Streptomyces sp. 549 TaxID=3049076 RepID=UPI0024C42131|nr:hypothetical protein [Streptomyces sp. 549]MDK1473632.1 hypothetical protein [Streptomyces sp. 549]
MAGKTVAKRASTRKTRTAPAKRRTTAAKRAATRKTRKASLTGRLARKAGTWAARAHTRRRTDRHARVDAAILRRTHAGCAKCGGRGVITKQKKDGTLAGSKPCPAKPTTTRAPRLKVAIEARYGQDKRSGLHGWSCPCGKRDRPRYRTPKDATKVLREHEKKRHGGQSIGGTWYVQIPATATTPPTKRPALAAA